MKKLSAVLAIMLVLVMTLSVAVSAGPDGIIENPEITVHYKSPTIDGNINTDEGWSVAALMNAETLGYYWAHNPLTSDGNVFYAVDDDGISIAGKIVEGLSAVDMSGIDVTGLNQFNYSTAPDDIDLAEGGINQYGWNGDVFGVMFDPLGALVNEGFIMNTDVSAWYMVGLFEGDVARVYRTHTAGNAKDGEITDQVQVAGKKLDDGWCFEMKLPWDMIISDTYDSSLGYVELTKEQILQNGNNIRAGALYQDRFYDEEQGSVQTWGRYITAPTSLPDGTPGHKGTGENIASYGIKLVLADIPETTPDPDPDPDSDTTDTIIVDYETGTGTTTDTGTGTGSSTTNGTVTGTGNGGDSAQTLDMGIMIALGALAASGIGIVSSKKRR